MRVITAVYSVSPVNMLGFPFHAIVAVYCEVSAIVAVGVAPLVGTVIPAIDAVLIAVGAMTVVAVLVTVLL